MTNHSSLPPERIPNDSIPISQNQWGHPGIFLHALTSALFGAMHAIAWKLEFPTVQEKMLWHAATIAATASPVVGLLLVLVAQLTVSSSDAHAFTCDCLRFLTEYSWHTKEKAAANAAHERLEKVYISRYTDTREAQIPYHEIFSGSHANQLPCELLDFLYLRGRFEKTVDLEKFIQDSFTDKFRSNFDHLVRLLEGEKSKRLAETAKTNVFPRKIWVPEWLNLCVLYSASVLYIIARLSLLAVGCSSLRRMPASVYVNTPWTTYIPTVG